MDTLPLDLDNIIQDYKNQLELNDKLKKVHYELFIYQKTKPFYQYYTINDYDMGFTNEMMENCLMIVNSRNKKEVSIWIVDKVNKINIISQTFDNISRTFDTVVYNNYYNGYI